MTVKKKKKGKKTIKNCPPMSSCSLFGADGENYWDTELLISNANSDRILKHLSGHDTLPCGLLVLWAAGKGRALPVVPSL